MSLALVVEAPLLALAERVRASRVAGAALLALAAAMALVAAAPSAALLFVGLALYGPASGVALAVSEAAAVASSSAGDPAFRERVLARLALAGGVGDALVPTLFFAAAALGLGWRAVAALAAGAALALAFALVRSRALAHPLAPADAEDEAEAGAAPPLRALWQALRERPALAGWLLVGLAADLLDETLVAFAAAHLGAFPGVEAAERAVVLAAWTAGDLVGLAALNLALRRFRPLAVLRVAALAAALALAAFACTRSAAWAALALALLGAASVALHPLLRARAYAALPERPALVGAAAALLAPAHLIAPLALAAFALVGGVPAALFALLGAPLLVAAAAWRARDAERGVSPSSSGS